MSNPLRPRRFDLIAFDWDGTLYDSTQIIVRCIQSAVVDVGGQKPTDEQAAYVIGMALIPALAHAAPDVPTETLRLPAPAGVSAIAVCPPDSAGRAPFVVATADEIWVVR